MGNRLKVAVFGGGSLGQWHAAKYAGMEDAELVGVYDVDPARAAEIAAKYETQAFDNMADLAEAAEAASKNAMAGIDLPPIAKPEDVFSVKKPFEPQ